MVGLGTCPQQWWENTKKERLYIEQQMDPTHGNWNILGNKQVLFQTSFLSRFKCLSGKSEICSRGLRFSVEACWLHPGLACWILVWQPSGLHIHAGTQQVKLLVSVLILLATASAVATSVHNFGRHSPISGCKETKSCYCYLLSYCLAKYCLSS